MKSTTYNCPFCNTELLTNIGNHTHPNDPEYGLTLYCGNRMCKIDVSGYTRTTNPAAAYEVIEDKYISHMEK
jgi:hypothetical protein